MKKNAGAKIAAWTSTRRRASKLLPAPTRNTKSPLSAATPCCCSAKTLQHPLQQADIEKLNDEELSVVTQLFCLSGHHAHRQATELMAQFQLEQLMVTCGDAGAWHLDKHGKRMEVGANNAATQVVDTVGAGDGFAAVSMLGSLQRGPIATTLQRANAFAAAICEIRGAVPEHADFCEPFIRGCGVCK